MRLITCQIFFNPHHFKKDAAESKMEIAFKIISGDYFTVHTSDKDKFGAEHAKKSYEIWLNKNK